MKHFLLVAFLFSMFAFPAFAQDIIVKRTGESIQTKVLEVTPTEVKYKRFESPDGPLYTLPKADITLITYADSTTEAFELPQTAVATTQPFDITPAEPVPAVSKLNLLGKGKSDAESNYKSYTGAGTGTLVASLLSPLAGLVPAIICSSVKPQQHNLDYPDQELFNEPAYRTGYTNQARKIKSRKVWKNWGIGFGVNLALALILANQ